MIVFTKLFYKNFLSTGNAGTTVLLNKNSTTLIQGSSGAGKSTFIDALCFALYGKPFRNINKPALINSINQKHLEVIIEFTTNGQNYKVVRGIKPAKFEIFCNDKLVNQDAAVKDYQAVLEDQILGMSFKTFTQIVILGSTSYTPFMQLNPANRREVIENILDIGIFSTMNQLLKNHMQEVKDKQTEVDADLKVSKTKADSLRHLVEVLRNKQNTEIESVQKKIDDLDLDIVACETEITICQEELTLLKEKANGIGDIEDAEQKLILSINETQNKITDVEEQQEFFNENDSCPVCSQSITSEHKHSMVNDLAIKAESLQERIDNLLSIKDKVTKKLAAQKELLSQVTEKGTTIKSLLSNINQLAKMKESLVLELEQKTTQNTDIEDTTKALKEVAATVIRLINEKKRLAEERELQDAASSLLKDTGVKTAIIREYLPLINKSINRYLNQMDLFIDFNLDENFNEVIRSRYRDEFTYGSFSAGEQLRVDLAILFSWRYISSLKNSCSTNLLVLDEILTGRLDNANADIVMDMINELALSGTNIFAIAHGDQLNDKFRSLIRFEKKNDYSVMV